MNRVSFISFTALKTVDNFPTTAALSAAIARTLSTIFSICSLKALTIVKKTTLLSPHPKDRIPTNLLSLNQSLFIKSINLNIYLFFKLFIEKTYLLGTINPGADSNILPIQINQTKPSHSFHVKMISFNYKQLNKR
ncbi:MAG: hypothetical protein HOA22_10960 [Gammaproteobacteria bacterium]|nr:hypothetical protein [Gammaproteobacteria bacterium]